MLYWGKHSKTAAMVGFLAVGLMLAASVGAAYAQSPVTPPGSGTQVDPYLISELGHLVWMSDNAASSAGQYYTMTADIDASATAGWNDEGTDTTALEGFKPIGTESTPFTGIFDGNWHTITGLVINRPMTNFVGLFGSVSSSGPVRNLGMVGGTVTGSWYVGSLVGYSYFFGTVSNCYATGAVTGSNYVGSLVGTNISGTVSNCYATGAFTAGSHGVGGLVGYNIYGTVSNCYATGTVTGSSYVGGLVGDNYRHPYSGDGGTVSNCYATGVVMGSHARVGGLVGNNNGTVSNCCATGAVTGPGSVGGLVGDNNGTVSNCYATGAVTVLYVPSGGIIFGGLAGYNSGTVSNCYATGAVTGDDLVGGLVGCGGGTVSNCYATGWVTGLHSYVGGLVGQHTNEAVFNSFWDMKTSGQITSAGGTGKTTAQMKQQATFAGWDFATIWDIRESVTYPQLRSLPVDSDGDTIPDWQDNCPYAAKDRRINNCLTMMQ